MQIIYIYSEEKKEPIGLLIPEASLKLCSVCSCAAQQTAEVFCLFFYDLPSSLLPLSIIAPIIVSYGLVPTSDPTQPISAADNSWWSNLPFITLFMLRLRLTFYLKNQVTLFCLKWHNTNILTQRPDVECVFFLWEKHLHLKNIHTRN